MLRILLGELIKKLFKSLNLNPIAEIKTGLCFLCKESEEEENRRKLDKIHNISFDALVLVHRCYYILRLKLFHQPKFL